MASVPPQNSSLILAARTRPIFFKSLFVLLTFLLLILFIQKPHEKKQSLLFFCRQKALYSLDKILLWHFRVFKSSFDVNYIQI
ncbi:MAG: hypothetical protein EAZ57_05500 [Cytophagales bacterium]|nr:MAG: hypothetical protein EAZ67_12925 [Cytophagales bacterium]TAF60999.1 MAG: hypothetical protein EAZ57_05500 [Cytophagales bacterium]